MNKTKIDWADMTWNPVTGCLHDCEYCYARKIADRFKPTNLELLKLEDCQLYEVSFGCYECDNQVMLTNSRGEITRKTPFPMGFKPTLHRHRLNEPQKYKKSQTVFVCSMADLFGNWVPDEWINEVFNACSKAPQHRYLFLTKNLKRYKDIEYVGDVWLGNSITKQSDFIREYGRPLGAKRFYSIEPILEPIKIPQTEVPKWVIIGAETGTRKNRVIPKKEWITNIKDQCMANGIPVFMKESLRGIMQEDFVQEFPWLQSNKNISNKER